ncbi:MAG: hypothetical protein IBJ18_10320 [Phycisphaerales bacterium]|nr:hypothetical protein [Phycisphaerales bacterium]
MGSAVEIVQVACVRVVESPTDARGGVTISFVLDEKYVRRASVWAFVLALVGTMMVWGLFLVLSSMTGEPRTGADAIGARYGWVAAIGASALIATIAYSAAVSHSSESEGFRLRWTEQQLHVEINGKPGGAVKSFHASTDVPVSDDRLLSSLSSVLSSRGLVVLDVERSEGQSMAVALHGFAPARVRDEVVGLLIKYQIPRGAPEFAAKVAAVVEERTRTDGAG